MATGCFDILHKGHLSYLSQAKRYGDYLVVVVARDKTIQREKHRTPHLDEKTRIKALQKIPLVDKAILGSLTDKLATLLKIRPDVLAIGYDQNINEEELQNYFEKNRLHVKIIRMKQHRPNIYKSSIFRAKHEHAKKV
ncbi:MAG: adenylyltransferase/cytidyltransferase family protein [Nanoarchaeota archaeon]